ncbi:MAG: DUF835 domain-containing protein [Thermoplasmata archaeon]
MKFLPLFVVISLLFLSFNGIANNSVIKNPGILWYSNFQAKLVNSTVSPQMLIYNNSILIGGNGSCYSYNSSNGKLNWIFNPEIPDLVFNTTPIAINNVAIIIGNTISSVNVGGNNKYNSAVFWLNVSDGSLLYQYNFTYNNPANKMVYAASPTKGIGGTFYVTTDGAIAGTNNVFLFSIYSNNPIKNAGIGAGIVNSAPLYYNNALYISFSVSTNNKVFYMLNPTTLANMPGSPSPLSFNNIYFYSSPVGYSNYVLFFSSVWNSSYYNPCIYVFFSYNFTFYKKIQINEQGYIENYEYIYNNSLYLVVNTTRLYALNISDMAISHASLKTSAFAGTGYMMYYVYNSALYSYDIGSNITLWAWKGNLASMAPVISNDIYSMENNGTLVCIGNARAYINVNYSPGISGHSENLSMLVYYETLNHTISYAGNYSINIYSPYYNLFNGSKNISLKTNVKGYANVNFMLPQVSNITVIPLNISSGIYSGLIPFNHKEIFITVYPSAVSLPTLPLMYNVSTHVLSYGHSARISLYTNATTVSNISINAVSTNSFFSIYIEKNIKNNSFVVYVNATQNYSSIQLTEVYLNISSYNYRNDTMVFSFAYQPYQKQITFLSNTQSSTLNMMNLILNILFIIIIAFLILYIALFDRRKGVKEDNSVIENISGVSEIFKDSTTMPLNEFKKKVIEHNLARTDNINKYIKMASSLNYISIDGNSVNLNISYKLSSLDWGSLYLMEGQGNSKTYAVISWLVSKGMNVLILSRMPPVKVFSKYKYPLEQVKVIWITNEEGKENIRPKDLEKLSLAIAQFIEKGNEGIIIIDQLEYLIINNSFTNVLKLLQNIKDHIATKHISLLVSINPESIDKQSYSLLLREAGDVL